LTTHFGGVLVGVEAGEEVNGFGVDFNEGGDAGAGQFAFLDLRLTRLSGASQCVKDETECSARRGESLLDTTR
jgi:hypothetical protein